MIWIKVKNNLFFDYTYIYISINKSIFKVKEREKKKAIFSGFKKKDRLKITIFWFSSSFKKKKKRKSIIISFFQNFIIKKFFLKKNIRLN